MLTQTLYGKERVRLVQVLRRPDRHDLRDLTVAMRFEGDYDASYTEGDNSAVLPTDTMKNTVYALAAPRTGHAPESFGRRLASHFLERNARLARVTIDITEHLWRRLRNGEREHDHAFIRTRSGNRARLSVQADRNAATYRPASRISWS